MDHPAQPKTNKLLVYTTCFTDPTTYWLTASLLASLELNCPKPRSFDVIVLTDESGGAFLQALAPTFANPPELIVGRPRPDRFNSTWSRYELFDVMDTAGYTHVLYLDPDVWVNADLNVLSRQKENIFKDSAQLLAFRDSNEAYRLVGSEDGMKFYGGRIFQKEGKFTEFADAPGFSTGIMFFRNTPEMQLAFREARTLARRYLSSDTKLSGFYRCDQPYVNYIATTRRLVDVHLWNDAVRNNPAGPEPGPPMFFHFTGGIGGQNKPRKLGVFISKLPVLPANWPVLAASLRLLLTFLAEKKRSAPIAAPSLLPRDAPNVTNEQASDGSAFWQSESIPEDMQADSATYKFPMDAPPRPQRNGPTLPAFVPTNKAASQRLNRAIPGQMTDAELQRLMELASRVPPGGVIVEVGCLYGLSTWHISKACADGVTVFCIDPWQRAKWIVRQVERPQSAPPFGREAFESFTAECKNLVMLQGHSPNVVRGWNLPVDLYFEDAVHTDPTLQRNIAFWTSRLKPGGIACGHDYCPRYPDVVSAADTLARTFGKALEIVDTLWSVTKPNMGPTGARGTA